MTGLKGVKVCVYNQNGDIVSVMASKKGIIVLGKIDYIKIDGEIIGESLSQTGPVQIPWETVEAIKEQLGL